MDKLLKILGIVMGVILGVGISVGFIGWLANSEPLFYGGICALIFLLPAIFVIYIIIFLIETIIEEKKNKK